MIYPKTIFRTVIALSTVAATTPATVASHRHPAHGDKRGKNGRYIDTTTNFYGTTATDALNVASPSSYIAAAGNPQVGVKLRKVTSPSNTGVMFSSASPTNAVTAAVNGYTNGKSGYVTVAKGYGSSPILSTRTLDYQGGREAVVNGGKGSVGTHTPPKPCTKGKKAHHGGDGATPGAPNGKASLKGSSGGHYDGANAPVSHKDGQGKQGLKTGENRDYGAPAHSHHQGEKSKKGSKPSTRGNNGGDVPSTGHTKAKGKKQGKGGNGSHLPVTKTPVNLVTATPTYPAPTTTYPIPTTNLPTPIPSNLTPAPTGSNGSKTGGKTGGSGSGSTVQSTPAPTTTSGAGSYGGNVSGSNGSKTGGKPGGSGSGSTVQSTPAPTTTSGNGGEGGNVYDQVQTTGDSYDRTTAVVDQVQTTGDAYGNDGSTGVEADSPVEQTTDGANGISGGYGGTSGGSSHNKKHKVKKHGNQKQKNSQKKSSNSESHTYY